MPTMCIDVTEQHITTGERGSIYRNPLSLALAEALGLRMVAVQFGPSTMQILEKRSMPESLEDNISVVAILARSTDQGVIVFDLPLPPRCQMFYRVFNYGPKSGPFAIPVEGGKVMRPYMSIIRPFEFELMIPLLSVESERAEHAHIYRHKQDRLKAARRSGINDRADHRAPRPETTEHAQAGPGSSADPGGG